MPTTAPLITSSGHCCADHPGRAEPPLDAGAAELGAGTRVALLALRTYKLALSPLFVGSCRYLPSCSDYAAEAIRTHGLLRGALLAARRLGRCHPFGGSGHDPVPPRRMTVSTEVAGRGHAR